MIYKNIFDLRGTDQQIAIVMSALDQIHYPWQTLAPPKGTFQIGWANLNALALQGGKLHSGDHPGTDEGDAIEGELEGRRYTMGVFYPSTGHSYIDLALVNYPAAAQTTVSAELSHLVDFFLSTFTDGVRRRLNLLVHGGIDVPHGHTEWWERANYGTEYFTLVAESWMGGFTFAYSDMDFDMGSFSHKFDKSHAPEIRRILGIERTDYVAPEPEPVAVSKYKRFGKSKVYHTLAHYGNDPDATEISDISGLRPCKVCKP